MPEPHSFTEDAAKRIANVVRLVESMHPDLRRGSSHRPEIQVILEGEYQQDLESPAEPDPGDDLVPTTATFRAYRGSGDDWALDEEPRNEITVTNRDTGFSAAEGDYGMVVELNGEWRPLAGGGGGDGVAFQIDSVDDSGPEPVATCTILARDNPKTTSPGEDMDGKIEVYDLTGCFFDEDAADLADRKGFARYMKVEGETDPKWVVHSLCCPPA